MHFSIPETEECKDNNGNTYTLYKIHVNGAHHCSVRYSQLHYLNEQIRKEFSKKINDLPYFPPKKLFALSIEAKEERRYHLERYIQLINQDPRILSSSIFKSFLLNAQKETQKEADIDVVLEIHLMNGEIINVNIKSYDQTDDILEKLMQQIKLNERNVYYFGLFLVKKDDSEFLHIIRKLQSFESPFISLKAANKTEPHIILLRKAVMDYSLEQELYEDRSAVKLLYIQAAYELQKGWVTVENDTYKQLKSLEDKNSRKDYLKLIATQKYYGYIHFKPCFADYPEPNTPVIISIGNRVLNLRVRSKKNPIEIAFKVTRIKCWKISSITGTAQNAERGVTLKNLELSIEYLFSKDTLKWITVFSEQAILMSMTLQSMVDEILLVRDNKTIKTPSERKNSSAMPFLDKNKTLVYNNSNNNTTNLQADDIEETKPHVISHQVVPRDENDLFEKQLIDDDDL